MKKYLLMFFMSAFALTAHAEPSFNCAKASTYVEKEICANSYLGDLDKLLDDDYKDLRESYVSADPSAVQEFKKIQKEWMVKRNACTTAQCIEEIYKSRIDEVCETPVLSGVNNCRSWNTLTADSTKSETVYDITCNAQTLECVYKVEGQVLMINVPDLTNYIQFGNASAAVFKNDLFVFNKDKKVIGLNRDGPLYKNSGKGNTQEQQEVTQQQLPTPATAPLQAGMNGNVINVRSLDNNLIIDKITINRGNCTAIDLKAKRDETNAYGEKHPDFKASGHYHTFHAAGIMVFGKEDHWQTDANCSIIEAVLDTNLGSWTVHGT